MCEPTAFGHFLGQDSHKESEQVFRVQLPDQRPSLMSCMKQWLQSQRALFGLSGLFLLSIAPATRIKVDAG